MSRYPYTIACDAIRMAAVDPHCEEGPKLSRSEASAIRSFIAKCIDMPDDELARRIADRCAPELSEPHGDVVNAPRRSL